MDKLINYTDLPKVLDQIKSRRSLVLAGGCFDILHPGHVEFLKAAKTQGDILLVMLENDASVKARKGLSRPINTQESRAQALSQIPQVDYVLLLPYLRTDKDYYDLVKRVQPDIIAVTAHDPNFNKKSEQAKLVGGKIVTVIERLPEHSTTEILERRNSSK